MVLLCHKTLYVYINWFNCRRICFVEVVGEVCVFSTSCHKLFFRGGEIIPVELFSLINRDMFILVFSFKPHNTVHYYSYLKTVIYCTYVQHYRTSIFRLMGLFLVRHKCCKDNINDRNVYLFNVTWLFYNDYLLIIVVVWTEQNVNQALQHSMRLINRGRDCCVFYFYHILTALNKFIII